VARKYTWLVLVGLIALGLVAVRWALRSGGGSLPVGQDTPQAVLRKLQRALAEGAKAEFLECFATRSEHHRAAVEALFDRAQAASRLRNALREAYGKSAWDTFVASQADPAEFAAFVWPRDEDVAAAAQVAVKGHEAQAKLASGGGTLTLQLEGVWRVEAFPRGSGVRDRREALARAVAALEQARARVGQGGATPESLAEVVRKRLAAEP
jgi:hypothetical protein